MATVTLQFDLPHVNVEFGPNVWWTDTSGDWDLPAISIDSPPAAPGPLSPVRSMYARLAQEYGMEEAVPDRRGGTYGDRFPF